MRNKKYQIIYADPPWQYNRKAGQGIAADHYPTMSLQEICDLPVGKLADKDCVLFLWVTFPQLREGLSVIQAWGFQYKTVAFVWVKKNKKADTLFLGLGHWTRSNAEICLLGEFEVINVPGNHVTCIHSEENATLLAQIIIERNIRG